MALSFKAKKRLIIGSFATVAAGWSGATALIPVAGPLLADTAGLTVLTTAMAYSLSILYNKHVSIATLAAFSTVAISAVLGQLALKAGASLIPVWGSYFNATVTFILHAATGWALCEIFETGKDIDTITVAEMKALIAKNKSKAEDEKKRFDRAMDQLPVNDRSEIRKLMKQMKNKELSASEQTSEQTEIMNRIISVFEKNGIDSPFEE